LANLISQRYPESIVFHNYQHLPIQEATNSTLQKVKLGDNIITVATKNINVRRSFSFNLLLEVQVAGCVMQSGHP
jgi:hypothetical protein